jgi:hypothetical protein
MKCRHWILIAVAVLGLASPCSAFDGMRKGFVLGGGLGLAPSATWKYHGRTFDGYLREAKETKAGGASNFIIGYGWDEQNLLVLEVNGASFESREFRDGMVFQAYGGPAWYHYLRPAAPGFFTVAGVGVYGFRLRFESGGDMANDSGLGLLGGVGYEFSRHWHVSLVINGGQTSQERSNWTHLNVETLIGGVAF